MKKDGDLEEPCGYLDPKKGKNTKKIWWSSEDPVQQPLVDSKNAIPFRVE